MELQLTSKPGVRATGTQRRWRSRLKTAGTLGTAIALGASVLALVGPAQAMNSNRTGAVDDRGFPTYYTDDSGLSLAICEDGTARCASTGPEALADRTDGENFYWSADANLNSSRGSLLIVMAHEAAFAATDQPMVFDRLRIRGTLSGAGTYTLQTPYGSKRFKVAAGARNVNVTEDLGCALTAGGFCKGHITNFLRSVSAPVGYMGNAATPTRVTGGTVRNEVVLKAPNGAVVGRTNKFTVMGKLAPGPAVALSADAVDFGNGTRVGRQSVALKNIGNSALALNNVAVAGAKTLTAAATGCAARASLAAGSTCRLDLVYRPDGRRDSAATVVISDNTTSHRHRVTMAAQTTSVFSAQRRATFSPRKAGTESQARRVLVENTGVVPMVIRGVSLQRGNVNSFDRRTGQGPLCSKGTTLRPGRSCATYVAFTPKSFGPKTTNLTISTNALSSPNRIVLTGRGR